MRGIMLIAGLGLAVAMLASQPAFAKRDAKDPRRLCREAIQKSMGLPKDAKVSRTAIDRCVANGGPV